MTQVKNKSRVKKEIGTFIVEQILEDVSISRSSVTGGRFKSLSKEYKKFKSKFASPIANMELEGDMLDALEFKPYRDGIEIGIFNFDQAQKADNHNKFSSASKRTNVPARKFIPNQKNNERFRPLIRNEIAEIIKDHE